MFLILKIVFLITGGKSLLSKNIINVYQIAYVNTLG